MEAPPHRQARAAVAEAAHEVAALGFTPGTSGNVSVRSGDAIAVTATGAALATARVRDVVVVGLDGEPLAGDLAPTSEIAMHLAVYARHGAGAIVHTHAPSAIAAARALDVLPVTDEEASVLGGPVRVAPYAPSGTRRLAAAAADALEGRTAAVLADHGTLAIGPDLASAVRATVLLERCAARCLHAARG